MKKFVLRVALIGMLMALMLLASAGAEIIDSGDSGVEWYPYTWTLDDAGTLTVSGTTVVRLCKAWEKYRDQIRTVVIEEGMTGIESRCYPRVYCYGYLNKRGAIRILKGSTSWLKVN